VGLPLVACGLPLVAFILFLIFWPSWGARAPQTFNLLF